MLFRVFKKSFAILLQNSVIIQPFVLFMFLLSVLLGSAGRFQDGLSPLLIVFLLSSFALCGAFLAGWLQLFQAAIRNFGKTLSREERAEASLASFREFLPAVGRFFVPVTIAMILYVLLFLGVFKLAVLLGTKYIGFSQNINPSKLVGLLGDSSKVYAFVETMSELDRKKLLQWDALILMLSGIYSYLTMFWFQAIMMNGENAFKGFVSGLKAVVAKPFVTFGIFLTYWVTNFATSVFSSIAGGNFILQLFNLMLVVFVAAYFIMVNFVYFEEYSGNNISGWTNIFR